MKNEFQKHKASDKVKWIIAFTLIFVLLVSMVGVILQAFTKYKPSEWFEKTEQTNDATGGLVVGESDDNNGISLLSEVIPLSDNDEYGVSPLASNSYNLVATVIPEGSSLVDYSVDWKNGTSEWAQGKNISDYLTVAQATDGDLTATLTCKKAFGEQAIVTATARANPDIFATVTVDYRQKYLATVLDIEFAQDYESVHFVTSSSSSSSEVAVLNCLRSSDFNSNVKNPIFATQISPVYSDYTIPNDFGDTIQYEVSVVPTIDLLMSKAMDSNYQDKFTLTSTSTKVFGITRTVQGAAVSFSAVQWEKSISDYTNSVTNILVGLCPDIIGEDGYCNKDTFYNFWRFLYSFVNTPSNSGKFMFTLTVKATFESGETCQTSTKCRIGMRAPVAPPVENLTLGENVEF